MRHPSIDIRIAGRKLRVACPKGQEDSLQQAAVELEARLKKVHKSQPNLSNEQVLLISALNLCHELAITKLDNERQHQQTQEKIHQLQATIESALSEQSVEKPSNQ